MPSVQPAAMMLASAQLSRRGSQRRKLDAGSADQSGEYPSGTLNARVAQRLQALAAIRRDFAHPEAKAAEKPDD